MIECKSYLMFHVIYTKTDSSVCIYACMYVCMYEECGAIYHVVHWVHVFMRWVGMWFTYTISIIIIYTFCTHTPKNKALISRPFTVCVQLVQSFFIVSQCSQQSVMWHLIWLLCFGPTVAGIPKIISSTLLRYAWWTI